MDEFGIPTTAARQPGHVVVCTTATEKTDVITTMNVTYCFYLGERSCGKDIGFN
jgi:hypothetical protein